MRTAIDHGRNPSPLRRLTLASTLLWAIASPAWAEDPPAVPAPLSLWNDHAPIGDGTFEKEDPQITFYPAEHPNGAAMVICPGGGYGGLVLGPEGQGIAQWLNGHGIGGVVLKYRLPKGRSLVPLLDAQRALRLVRAHRQEWSLDPQKIGIIGFSAGGHLASTAGTHFDAGDLPSDDPIERLSCRPDFMVLVYPVISMGDRGHAGSRLNLLGPTPAPEIVGKFSNERQVTPATPPTFLAHALDDKVVPLENSQMFFDALQRSKVPAKLLQLPEGGHGLNHYQGPMWEAWQSQALEWLADQKFISAEDARRSR